MATAYIARIRKCFAEAYDALVRHEGAKTVEQFKAAAADYSDLAITDEFLSELLVAIYSELAREYKRQEM